MSRKPAARAGCGASDTGRGRGARRCLEPGHRTGGGGTADAAAGRCLGDGWICAAGTRRRSGRSADSGRRRAGGTSVRWGAWGPARRCGCSPAASFPTGADSILLQEDATRDGDIVQVNEAVVGGRHIRRAGQDFAAGDVVMPVRAAHHGARHRPGRRGEPSLARGASAASGGDPRNGRRDCDAGRADSAGRHCQFELACAGGAGARIGRGPDGAAGSGRRTFGDRGGR